MLKASRDMFTNNEVLFVGYSERNNKFSQMVYRGFSENDIKVYPYNTKDSGNYDIKVYQSIEELPKIPECAYILLNKDNTRQAVNSLADKGIKKVLIHTKKSVDDELLERCENSGIQVAIACPMMLFGSGIHWLHGFFAGVKR